MKTYEKPTAGSISRTTQCHILVLIAKKSEVDIRDMPGATWCDVVAAVLEQCTEPVTLTFLYEKIKPHKKRRQTSGGKKRPARHCRSIPRISFMMDAECGL